MATSKANPGKLSTYAGDGLELSNSLRAKANDVDSSVSGLSSPYLPDLGTGHTDFKDLAGDWWHLDEFAGDVAQGFYKASGLSDRNRPIPEGMVVTVDDGALAEQGHVGYADRDEAVARAEAMADELRRLRRDGASPEDIQDFAAMADRGKYDSAFAVTFSNEVGVAGYNDATALIRTAYEDDGLVPPEGIAVVHVLGTMLTTALDTRNPIGDESRVGIDDGDRLDPDNADLPWDMRIDESFVHDLMSDYQPSAAGGFDEATDTDLSVLLRFTDPPTDVAREIANNRMTPVMANTNYQWDASMTEAEGWGQYSGRVTNYATMLGRNDEASTFWLKDGNNLELTLERWGDYDVDGGEALAGVVDNGLTYWDTDMRESLMKQTIDHIGGEQDEIRNQFLHNALANGVDSNMDVIDGRINGGGQEKLLNTHDFLRETMGNEDAAQQVRSTILEYTTDKVYELPGGEGDRSLALEKLGKTLGVFTQADANAILGADADRAGELSDAGTDTDALVGLVPGLGQLNSGGEILFDGTVGDGTTALGNLLGLGHDPDTPTRATINADGRVNTWGLMAVAGLEDGTIQSNQALEDAGVLTGSPGDPNRSLMPISEMSDDQKAALSEWVENVPHGSDARHDQNSLLRGWVDNDVENLDDRH